MSRIRRPRRPFGDRTRRKWKSQKPDRSYVSHLLIGLLYAALVVFLLRFLPLLLRISDRYGLTYQKYVLLGATIAIAALLIWKAWIHLRASFRRPT